MSEDGSEEDESSEEDSEASDWDEEEEEDSGKSFCPNAHENSLEQNIIKKKIPTPSSKATTTSHSPIYFVYI